MITKDQEITQLPRFYLWMRTSLSTIAFEAQVISQAAHNMINKHSFTMKSIFFSQCGHGGSSKASAQPMMSFSE